MATLDHSAISAAATLLWRHWTAGTTIPELPHHCRPADRSDGYAIQAAVAGLSGQRVVGWKIAATSLVGQTHIGVDGPLAGRLLSGRVMTITTDASGANSLAPGQHDASRRSRVRIPTARVAAGARACVWRAGSARRRRHGASGD